MQEDLTECPSIGYQFAFARGKIFPDARSLQRRCSASGISAISRATRSWFWDHQTVIECSWEGLIPSLLRWARTRVVRVLSFFSFSFSSFFSFFFTAWRATRMINIFARSSCISEQGNQQFPRKMSRLILREIIRLVIGTGLKCFRVSVHVSRLTDRHYESDRR